MPKKIIFVVIVATLLVGGGSFYGGLMYGKKGASSNNPGENSGRNFGNRNGGQGQRSAGPNGGGFIAGSVLSKDNKSVTVKTRDGSSKIIFFSDSTQVGKSIQGSSSDLSVGQDVMVNGKANDDGSLTAENIQIRSNMNQ